MPNEINFRSPAPVSGIRPPDETRAPNANQTSGAIVAAAALTRARAYGAEYAQSAAPRSPHPLLTGNDMPGISRLTWLRDRYKCNQFVGDVLTDAGIVMPTYRMPDGSLHYVNAEALPKFSSHFTAIGDPRLLQHGDVIVLDTRTARGENGAHAEIVTGINQQSGILRLTGAHASGAFEKDYSALFRSLRPDGGKRFLSAAFPGKKIVLLRPVRPLLFSPIRH